MSAGILRHRIDILSVLNVVGVLAFQFAALLFDWSWLLLFPLVLLARQVNLVEHNHAHLRIFHNRTLNDALGWMCFLSNGVPLEFYEVHHVKNHHRHNNTLKDWSSAFTFPGCRYPDKPVSRGLYILTFPYRTIRYSLIDINSGPTTRVFRRFWTSVLVVTSVCTWLIYMNPAGFAVFFAAVWVIIFFGLGLTNYRHHHGCAFTDEYDSSNVMLGLPYEALGFNIGFHVSHHMKPALHWSRLADHHRSVEHKVPAENYRGRIPSRPAPGPHDPTTAPSHP